MKTVTRSRPCVLRPAVAPRPYSPTRASAKAPRRRVAAGPADAGRALAPPEARQASYTSGPCHPQGGVAARDSDRNGHVAERVTSIQLAKKAKKPGKSPLTDLGFRFLASGFPIDTCQCRR